MSATINPPSTHFRSYEARDLRVAEFQCLRETPEKRITDPKEAACRSRTWSACPYCPVIDVSDTWVRSVMSYYVLAVVGLQRSGQGAITAAR